MLKNDVKSNGDGYISPPSSTSSSPCKGWNVGLVTDDVVNHSNSEYEILSQTKSPGITEENTSLSNADCLSDENEMQDVFDEVSVDEVSIERANDQKKSPQSPKLCSETNATTIKAADSTDPCTADIVTIDNTFTKLNNKTRDNQVSEASSCISPTSRPKNQNNVAYTKVTSL